MADEELSQREKRAARHKVEADVETSSTRASDESADSTQPPASGR